MASPTKDAVEALIANIGDVERLTELHETIAGDSAGRRYGLEVLNKSGIVLLVACWEAFVEDLAQSAFDYMLLEATSHTTFPPRVLAKASQGLKQAQDGREIWKLAGDGWKAVLQAHRTEVLDEYIGKLNTPKPEQVNALMEALIGLSGLSSRWKWKGTSVARASEKLTKLIELRGSIAHRVSPEEPVHKADVVGYKDFVYRLAVKSSNAVRTHVGERTGQFPWGKYKFGGVS